MTPARGFADGKGLVRLTAHLLTLTATGVMVVGATGPWLVPAMAGHGIVLVSLFAPLHETIHRTAFRSRRLNDGVARVVGFLLLLPCGHFRRFHLAHHRHAQDRQRDPERAQARPGTVAGYLLAMSGLPYWWEQGAALVRHARGRVDDTFVPVAERSRVTREARWHLTAYAAVAALAWHWPAVLGLWLLPAVLGQPFLRLILLAEHVGCAEVPEMTVNSRTTITNPLVRFLMWNMPFHAEHHAHPEVPFHALPALHERMAASLAATTRGYWRVHHEYVRGLHFFSRHPPLG